MAKVNVLLSGYTNTDSKKILKLADFVVPGHAGMYKIEK